MIRKKLKFRNRIKSAPPTRLRLAAAAVMLVSSCPAVAAGLTFQSYVDRTRVTVTEAIKLTVEVSGDNLSGVGTPPPPQLSNLEVAGSSTSTSQNISLEGRRMTRKVTRSTVYLLMPLKPGPALIRAAALNHEGKIYRTKPIQIQVIAAGGPPAQPGEPGGASSATPSPAAEGRPLFLTAAAAGESAYVNEPVLIEYTLYTQARVEGVEMAGMPEAVGFTSEVVPPPDRYQSFQKIIEGRRYTAVKIRQMVLYPKVAGKNRIGPMTLNCQVRVSSGDPFFGDWLGSSVFGRTIVRKVSSPAVEIEVLDLPQAGRPDGFKGEVGEFQISAATSSRATTAGEPITLTVEIEGRGNLKSLSEPDLGLSPDFRLYPPEVKLESSLRNGTMEGKKSFSYLVVPREPGEYELGPILLPYFDIGSGIYRLARASAGLLTVGPGGPGVSETDPAAVSRRGVTLLKQEIRYIKEPDRELKTNRPPWNTFLFWLALLLPAASLLSSTLFQRHRTRLTEDIAYARDRRAYNSARRRLKEARRLMQPDRSREFHSALGRAVREFVADKFNRPAPGLSRDEIDRLAAGRGVPEEVRQGLAALLDNIDLAQYAALRPTGEEMTERLKEAEEILTGLARRL